MSKMSTELTRHALNGATMGTRWSALFFAGPGLDTAPIRTALQAAVDEVDGQMSTWKPDSGLMRLNAAPVGEWIALPARLAEVLRLGLKIGRISGGAFDIGMGDAVTAWGFGPKTAAPEGIRAAMKTPRRPADQMSKAERRSSTARATLNAVIIEVRGFVGEAGLSTRRLIDPLTPSASISWALPAAAGSATSSTSVRSKPSVASESSTR